MNEHTAEITTSTVARPVDRDQIIEAFRPLATLLRDVITDARDLCDLDVAATAYPGLRRPSCLRRLSGYARWMHIAEGIVERRDELPAGFAVESTDEQHNGGRYRFRFPGGVFTVKRTPHRGPDEGRYLQTRLTGFEDVALDPSIDLESDVVVLISAGPRNEPRLLVTHTSLPSPLVIELRELADHQPVAVGAAREQPRTVVRSTRAKHDAETAEKEAE